MKRLYRIYIFSVSGALGGLVASMLHQYVLLNALSGQLEPARRYTLLAVLGTMIGASIGFFPSFVEGKGIYSLRGALRVGFVGALLGAIGGLFSFPPAEWLLIQINGGWRGRAIAFSLVGVAVGVAAGISGGARPWRAILGGFIGGLSAGWIAEFLISRPTTRTDSGIIALMLIGLFIALFISAFINVLSEAWLEGQPGSKVDGNIYHLSKFRAPQEALIGSDKKSEVFIYVPDARLRHASITLTRNGARLKHIATEGQTLVGGAVITEHLLRDQEVIEIGNSKLKYRERHKSVLLTAGSNNTKGGTTK